MASKIKLIIPVSFKKWYNRQLQSTRLGRRILAETPDDIDYFTAFNNKNNRETWLQTLTREQRFEWMCHKGEI